MNTELVSFAKILDYMIDDIYVINNSGQIIYANESCRKRYAPIAGDIIGKKNPELYALGCYSPSIMPLIRKEKHTITVEQKVFDGQIILTTCIPITDENDEIECVICCSRDIKYLNSAKYSYADIETKMQSYSINIDKEVEDNFRKLMDKNSLLSNNQQFIEILRIIDKVAPSTANILITGDTGTGKTLLAQHIHNRSNQQGNFVSLNCATIPEQLFESELFGYVKGAFTGAAKDTNGLFDAANGGTLFLDEISEIPHKFQAKLLKAIQEKTFYPVGSTSSKKVDIRIIAASNQNFAKMIDEKNFRADLFYRLNVINLELPCLAERIEDIPFLVNFFFKRFNAKYKVYKAPTAELLSEFTRYSWPGNIRELENIIERLILLSESDQIGLEDLPYMFKEEPPITETNNDLTDDFDIPSYANKGLKECINQFEKALLIDCYQKHNSSYKIAKKLKISQPTAHRLLQKHNIGK